MPEKVVILTSACKMVLQTYQSLEPDLTLEYIEYACDHYSSNTETDVYIDKEKAIEIIDLLKEAYGI